MRSMFSRLFILGLVLAFAFGTVGCGGGGEKKADTIKIGVIAPLSGNQASIGKGVVDGMQSAAKIINGSGGLGGKQIELIVLDDRNLPDEAVSAAKKLISGEKVSIILGSIGSSSTAAIQQLTMKQKVVLVTPVSMLPKLSQNNDQYFFRVTATAPIREQSFSEFVSKKLNAKTIAFLASNEDLGRATVAAATNLYEKSGNPKPVYTGFYDPGATDFSAELNRIKSLSPDVLYIVANSVQASMIVKQVKVLQLKSVLIGSGEAATQEFLRLSQGAGEGMYIPVDWAVSFDDPASKKFLEAFQKDYNKLPETKFAVQGWETMWIVAEAIKRVEGPLTSDKLRDQMRKTDWLGPRGKWAFDANGDPVLKTYISQVKGNDFIIAK
ncbi:MAG TPA: ABC transporter substrate-binding protein [Negativicutes bacterium]|nr:ABC transporter substrate-binding protein [Negativicutes bacterium]